MGPNAQSTTFEVGNLARLLRMKRVDAMDSISSCGVRNDASFRSFGRELVVLRQVP